MNSSRIFATRCFPSWLLGSLLLTFGLVGCKEGGDKDVTDLYRFPIGASETKDIQVQVNVSLGAGLADGTVDLESNQFVLNAFLIDASGLQVEIGRPGETPVLDLPVSLTGIETTFDAVVRVPIDAESGEDGYSFHFSLKQASSGLAATSSSNLDALRGAVVPGTAAVDNPVDLSLASTVAYGLLDSLAAGGSAKGLASAYADILLVLPANVFDDVDAVTPHKFAAYVTGIIAKFQNAILTDKTLQSKVAEYVFAAIDADQTDETRADAAQKFADAFTTQLKTMAQAVQDGLGTADSASAKVFKSGVIDTSKLPDPSTYDEGVYAPAAVAFTDKDLEATIGGSVVITPPSLTTGISYYNVYYGGDTRAKSQLKLAGKVAVDASPLALQIANGTTLPSGATRFWVFPVAKETQLDLPASGALKNIESLKAPILKQDEIISFAASATAGAKLPMTNTGGGSLTSCTFDYDPGFAPATFSIAVSSDKKTCIVNLDHTVTGAIVYSVQVTATNATGSSTVDATFEKVAALTAPDITSQSSYDFASTSVAGATLDLANTGGGELTSCTMDIICLVSGPECSPPNDFTVSVSDDGDTCTVTLNSTSRGTVWHLVTITATNAVGSSSLVEATITRPLPVPNVSNQTIVFPASAVDGDEVVVPNTGGIELTACDLLLSHLTPPVPFTAAPSGDAEECVVQLADKSAYTTLVTAAIEATNNAGSDTATLSISIADAAPDITGQTVTFPVSAVDGDELEVTNVGGGNLTSCTMDEAPIALYGAPFTIAVSGDRSTCVITLNDKDEYQGPTDMEVTATNSAGSSVALVTLVVSTLAAPDFDPESITIRDTDSPRAKDLTNQGGGSITSCAMTPIVRSFAVVNFSIAPSDDNSTCTVTYTGNSSGMETMDAYVTATNAAGTSVQVVVTMTYLFTGR